MPYAGDGTFFAHLDKQQKQEVINRVAKEAAKRFQNYRNAIHSAFDFRELDSQGRLALYRARTTGEWSQKQEAFPQEFKDQLRDWYFLERRIRAQSRPVQSELPFETPGGPVIG